MERGVIFSERTQNCGEINLLKCNPVFNFRQCGR